MNSKINQKILKSITLVILVILFLSLFLGNSLLYHVIIELIAIILAVNMFTIALSGYQVFYNSFFAFLGISYGFVAFFDFLHFLSHPGINIIRTNNLNLSAQLWLVGRLIEGVALLLAFNFLKQKKIKKLKTVIIYSLFSFVVTISILRWNILPNSYLNSGEMTAFKIGVEILIIIFVTAAAILLFKKKAEFHEYNFKLLLLAMIITISAEIFFINNLLTIFSHALKTLSVYLVYLTLMRKFTEEVEQLSQAVEQSPSTVVITDLNSEIEYVNPKFTEVTGYEYEEVKGKTPGILKSGRHSKEFYQNLWESIKSGNEWRDEFYNQRKNGEYYWEDASISPIEDNNGDINHFLKVGEEITERKEYEKELKEKSQQLKEANNKIIEDLNKAKELHELFLPTDFPKLDKIECATYYQPAEKIGGDFYNTVKIDDLLIFYVVDVTGHGLDGAMLNIFIRGTIDSFLLSHSPLDNQVSPADIIEFILAEFKKENFPADYFICLALGVINLATKELSLSNAGIQIPPILISQQGEMTELKEATLPISTVIKQEQYEFSNQKIKLAPGDSLLITTDGLIEEEVAGENYGISRFKDVVTKNHYLPPEFLVDKIIDDFYQFSGRRQGADDITIFSLHYKLGTNKEKTWELESDLEEFYALKTEFVEILDECSIKSDLKQGLLIVLQELIINAIEHGNQFSDDKKVYVRFIITDSDLRLVVEDEGRGFDWKSALEYDELNLEEGTERGRGIIITKMISDYLTYNQAGSRVYFLKRRD